MIRLSYVNKEMFTKCFGSFAHSVFSLLREDIIAKETTNFHIMKNNNLKILIVIRCCYILATVIATYIQFQTVSILHTNIYSYF